MEKVILVAGISARQLAGLTAAIARLSAAGIQVKVVAGQAKQAVNNLTNSSGLLDRLKPTELKPLRPSDILT